MRQQLRLKVLLPVAVLGLLGAGFGAYAFGQAPEPGGEAVAPTTTAPTRTGAGGSGALTPAAWAKAANAVCRKAEKAYADVPQPSGVAQLEAFLAKVVQVSEWADPALAELGRPQGGGGTVKALAENSADRVRLAGRALAAARSGDGTKFRRSLARLAAVDAERADLMRRLGATTCTSASRVPASPTPSPADASPARASLAAVRRELLQHPAVVLVFYTPDAGLDGTTVVEARSAALEVGAGFLAVDAGDEKEVSKLGEAYEVTEAPAVLVLVRGPTVAARFDRFADRETIAQAVQNAVR
jgi:hypothetical protein